MTDKIAIVGTGLIGRGWAIVFARAGYRTVLWDPTPGAVAAALGEIEPRLVELERHGLVASAEQVRGRLSAASSLEQAIDGVAYVQESAPERVEVKAALFAEIDRMAPASAILGSSVSAIPPSDFLEGVPGRARCLGVHPANPPYLIPLVELVPSRWTDPAAVEGARSLMLKVGQKPILCRKEVPGFVLNRLQAAVINEAIHLVADGVADPADVDATISEGLGLRWAFMGPFQTMDLNAPAGFKDYATRYGGTYQTLGEDLHVSDPWPAATIDEIEAWRRAATPSDEVGARQFWRDRRMMALARHKAEQES